MRNIYVMFDSAVVKCAQAMKLDIQDITKEIKTMYKETPEYLDVQVYQLNGNSLTLEFGILENDYEVIIMVR